MNDAEKVQLMCNRVAEMNDRLARLVSSCEALQAELRRKDEEARKDEMIARQ